MIVGWPGTHDSQKTVGKARADHAGAAQEPEPTRMPIGRIRGQDAPGCAGQLAFADERGLRLPGRDRRAHRRDRRRAKKNWRRDDHAQRMAWLRDQRQAEPTSPAVIVALVVVLAIVILGLGGGLPRLFGGKGD